MRKLVYAINLTLDGCCDHSKGAANEEVHRYHTALLQQADVLLYGRTTYELMVPFWPEMAAKASSSSSPSSVDEFAAAFVRVPKIVVVSHTLQVDDARTTVIRDDLAAAITALKNDGDATIQGAILVGGVDLPGQLLALGLVDEVHVLFQPFIVGEGRRLFDTLPLPQLGLQLRSSKVLSSGGIALHYALAAG